MPLFLDVRFGHHVRVKKKRVVRRHGGGIVKSEKGRRLYLVLLDVDAKDAGSRPEGVAGAFLNCYVRAPGGPETEAALPRLADDLDITINAIDEVKELPSIPRDRLTLDLTDDPLMPQQPELTFHWYPPDDE